MTEKKIYYYIVEYSCNSIKIALEQVKTTILDEKQQFIPHFFGRFGKHLRSGQPFHSSALQRALELLGIGHICENVQFNKSIGHRFSRLSGVYQRFDTPAGCDKNGARL
jgi:hypothetical protein